MSEKQTSQRGELGPYNRTAGSPFYNLPEEEVLAESERWRLVRTKTMKGHKERLMLVHKEHVKSLD